MDEGVVYLSFSEPIFPEDAEITEILLQSTSIGGSMYYLNNSTISAVPGTRNLELMIELSREDLKGVKLFSDLARDRARSYVDITMNAFSDPAGNQIMSAILQASMYTTDGTGPRLVDFDLDLDAGMGELVLSFDDVINLNSLDATHITLQSDSNRTAANQVYSLTGGATRATTTDYYTITLPLTQTDSNVIKTMRDLATGASNTYITMTSEALSDQFDNPVIAVVSRSGRMVQNYTADKTSPVLTSFTLDLNSGSLMVVFSETVDIRTLDVTEFTLHDQSNGTLDNTTSLTLSSNVRLSQNDAAVFFSIYLDNNDLNFIKEADSLVSNNDSISLSFLSITELAIKDMAGNNVTEIPVEFSEPADTELPDLSAPFLTSASLDLNRGIVYLNFNESMSASSLDPAAFYLISQRILPPNTIHLNGTVSTDDGPDLFIQLTTDVLNDIKADVSLAVSNSSTFIAHYTAAVSDLNDQEIRMLSNGDAVVVMITVEDMGRPSLDSFYFDLNSGEIVLMFDETVNASSLNLTQLTLLNVANTFQTAVRLLSRPLTSGAMVTPPYGPTLTVKLVDEDFFFLQKLPDFGTTTTNTYLSLVDGSILDTSDLPVNPIPPTTSLQASMIVQDTNPPQLRTFTFDLNMGVLIMTFSEVIPMDTVVSTEFTIQDSANGGGSNLPLSGGYVNNTDSNVINLVLDRADLDSIKALPSLAVDVNSTFLSFTQLAANDTQENRVSFIPSSNAEIASGFVPDTTPPRLVSFDVLRSGTVLNVILRFSETVSVSSLDLTAITLQDDDTTPSMNYTLQTASTSSLDGPNITLVVNTTDIDAIRLRPPIGQTSLTTFIVLPGGAVNDTYGVPIDPIVVGVPADVITSDFLPPELESFSLDLTSKILLLTFSDTVLNETIFPPALTLQSRNNSDVNNFTLTTGVYSVIGSTGNIVEFVLDDDDLNAIKADPELAVNMESTFISLTTDFIQDKAGLNNLPILSSSALQVSDFEPDRMRPTLDILDLDLNTGVVVLTFSETVNVSTFMPSMIAFQGVPSNPLTSVQLTGGNVTTVSPSHVVEFVLLDDDLNRLKADPTIAYMDMFSTFITMTADSIYDMNGNRLRAISSAGAKMADFFTDDMDHPSVYEATLNLNTNILTILFTETVNVTTFDPTFVSFFSSPSVNATDNHTLNSSRVISGISPTVEIQLSTDDINTIKTLSLCVHSNASDCYLYLPENTTYDMVNRGSLEFNLMSITVLNDTTPPFIEEFVSFNLQTGEIVVRMSESVNHLTVMPALLTLQGLYETPLSRVVSLTGTTTSTSGPTVSLTLSMQDLAEVKVNEHVCVYRGDCYLVADIGFVEDVVGIPSAAVQEVSPGLIVTTFIYDTIVPSLMNVTFDLNQGLLSFTFDEPVDVDSYNTSGVTIQDSSYQPGLVRTLTGGTVTTTTDRSIVNVKLTREDLNNIKANGFGTGVSNTFVVLANNTVFDLALAPNGNELIENGTALSAFTGDFTSPMILLYTLDLEENTLTITFDEPVDPSTLQGTFFNLSSQCGGNGSVVTLGLTALPSSDRSVLVLDLTADVTEIKVDTTLAVSVETTYLSVASGAIEDLFFNGLRSVSCIQPGVYQGSITRLRLDSFDLDRNTGVLNLTFTDVVDSLTFTADGIVFQSVMDTDLYPGSPTYGLTSGSRTNSPNGNLLVVQLSHSDLLNLNSIPALATDANDTYLTIRADVVDDTRGEDMIAITDGKALKVTNFYGDSIPPELSTFTLDMNLGQLNLTFSETINETSVVYEGISLYANGSINATMYTLTSSGSDVVRSIDGFTAVIYINDYDLNNIKAIFDLGTSMTDTHLAITAGTITDLANNPVLPSVIKMVSNYTADETPPTLQRWTLDMDTGLVVLTFSETVDIDTFDASGLFVQNFRNTTNRMGETVTLSSTNASVTDNGVVSVYLNLQDRSSLQAGLNLATARHTSYLGVLSVAINDTAANQVVEISSQNALIAANYTADATDPVLESFSVNMETSVIDFTFSEVILTDSFDPTAVTLQNVSVLVPASSVVLTGGMFLSSSWHTLSLQLNFSDANQVKFITDLATSMNDTFISFTDNAFNDAAGRKIVARPSNNALMAFMVIPDGRPPVITNFTLDLNSSFLVLTFDEIVRGSTLNVSYISLLSSDNTTLSLPTVTLTTSTVVLADDYIIEVQLSVDDINSLVLEPTLATDASTTFLSVDYGAVYDFNSNPFNGTDTPIPASLYVRDSSPPELVTLSVDMTQRTLTLDFDEPVDISSLRITRVRLQNALGGSSYTLTNVSSSNSSSGGTVVIDLGQADFDSLGTFPDLYTSLGNSYIVLSSGAISDPSGTEIRATSPLQASLFINDTIPPELVDFQIDLITGVIRLNFSETINVLTLDPTLIVIQSDGSASPTSNVTLSRKTSMMNYSSVVELQLSRYDFGAIKADTNLATDANNTFIRLLDGAITDAFGVPINETVLPASSVEPDTANPNLVSFSLDLDQRVLVLQFDEAVDPASVMITEVMLSDNIDGTPGLIRYQIRNTSSFIVENFTSVRIDLSVEDAVRLSRPDLCTNRSNCYITFSSLLLRDTSTNPVNPIFVGEPITSFTNDTTRPSLVEFTSFDFNNGQLMLSFSETVNVDSINTSAITLYEVFSHTGESVTLSGGELPTVDDDVITITLTTADVNALKQQQRLCRNRFSCNIVFGEELLSDRAGNTIEPTSPPMVFVLSETGPVLPDVTPPMLLSYSLDMNSLTLSFYFDEIVDAAASSARELTLVDAVNGSISYTLTDSNRLTTTRETFVEIQLGPSDEIAIKATLGLATSRDNTFAMYAAAFVRDVGAASVNGSNLIVPVLLAEAEQATNYTPDSTPPNVVSFDVLNINEAPGARRLEITADEPLSDDVIIGGITLYPFATGGTGITLSEAAVSYDNPADKRTIIVTLSDEDLKTIKLNTNTPSMIFYNYLGLLSGTLRDTAGNNHTAINGSSPLRSVAYTPDTTPPRLDSYILDMDEGLIQATFSDIMDPASYTAERLVFISAVGDPESSGLRIVGYANSTADYSIDFRLLPSDLNALKARTDLATSLNDSVISISSDFISDLANLGVVSTQLAAANFTADETPPELLAFELDLDGERLILSFSEVVDLTTFNVTSFTLQNTMSGLGDRRPLSGGTPTRSGSSVVVEIQLVPDDINYIKSRGNFGTGSTDTFLSLDSTALEDFNGNNIEAVPINMAQPVSNVSIDVSNPLLVSFNLDMNTGLLELTFSESVDASSLQVSSFTILAAPSSSIAHTLTSTIKTSDDGINVNVTLNDHDLNSIKATNGLATSNLTTYITHGNAAVMDTSTNPIDAITMGISVTTYTPDVEEPELDGFILNLDGTPSLILTFSETVSLSSINASAFALQSSEDNAIEVIPISNGTILSSNLNMVTIGLETEDANQIKRSPLIGQLVSTFITVETGAAADRDGNELVGVNASNAIRASNVILDRTPPELEGFHLDLESDPILYLTFSEIVDGSPIMFESIGLKSSEMGPIEVNLTVNEVLQPFTSSIVPVNLSREVSVALKSISTLCQTRSNCFIEIQNGTVNDLFTNSLLGSVGVQATMDPVADITPPNLLYFDAIEQISNPVPFKLVLYFDEPVMIADNSSLIPSVQLLSNSSELSAVTYNLSRSYFVNLGDYADVEIYLETSDLIDIQMTREILTGENSTFLRVFASNFSDVYGNTIMVSSDPQMVRNYVGDFVPPELVSFSLDLNTQAFVLTFSEAVNVTSLDPQFFHLQNDSSIFSVNMAFPNNTRTEVGSSPEIVNLFVMRDFIDALLEVGIGSSNTTTFISYDFGATYDNTGHAILELPRSNALQVDMITPNLVPPELREFTFTFNPSRLSLTFSKVVNRTTFEPRFITLQSAPGLNALSYTLTGGELMSTSSNSIQTAILLLTEEDRNAILAIDGLGETVNNTWISVAKFLVGDLSGIESLAISPRTPLQATFVGNDTQPPSLNSFDLDLNSGELVLYFNETIVASTLDITTITLLIQPGNTSGSVEISGGHFENMNSAVITISLREDDLNAIKESDLCSNSSLCYLAYTSVIAYDTSNLSSVLLPLASAIPVRTLAPDTLNPLLVEFAVLDLNKGEVVLIFDEAVDPSTFTASGLTLTSLFTNWIASHQLTAATMVATGNSTNVTVVLSDVDLMEIKKDPNLCVLRSNCYAYVDSTLVADTAGLPLSNTSNSGQGRIVTTLLPDVRGPTLNNFTLDLSREILILTFSEPVDPETLNADGITLQAEANVTSSELTFTLTSGMTLSPPGREITVDLAHEDANVLRSSMFATSESDTFISINSTTIKDMAFNANDVVEIRNGFAIRAQLFIADTVGPNVQEFTLDLQTDILSITFNEPVLTDTFVVMGITLQSSNVVGDPVSISLMDPLTEVLTMQTITETIDVKLQRSDISTLKLNSSIGTGTDNTFIVLDNSTVMDVSNITNLYQGPYQATNLYTDTSRTTLNSFTLDMNTGMVALTFSDVVDTGTLKVASFGLQNASVRVDSAHHQLANSTVMAAFGHVVMLKLSDYDRLHVAEITNLGITINDTYITMTADAFDDYRGVDVIAITDGNALMASNVSADVTPLDLVSVTFDMNSGLISLLFNDFVDLATFNSSGVAVTNNDTVSPFRLDLSNVTEDRSIDGFSLLLSLSDDDLNLIKSRLDVAISNTTSCVSLAEDLVLDLAQNGFSGGETCADRFIPDKTPPQLSSFAFDLNLGILDLTFSETVDNMTLDVTTLSLQSADQMTAILLSGGNATQLSHTTVKVYLEEMDIFDIKLAQNVGSSLETTFLTVTNTTIADTNNNFIAPSTSPAADFTNDTVNPEFVSFNLDINTGVLSLLFSEPVDSSTLDVSAITLTNGRVPTANYTLTAADSVPENRLQINVTLSAVDLDQLKIRTNLATIQGNTYISFLNSTVLDMAGNPLLEIPVISAEVVDLFEPDVSPPGLVSFTLNLDLSTVVLTFTEVVEPSSFMPTGVTILSSNDTGSPPFYTLMSTPGPESASNIVTLHLSIPDTEALRIDPDIATTIDNTFIVIDNGSLQDFSNNTYVTQLPLRAASVVMDQSGPLVREFSLDLNSGVVSITFSEPVNVERVLLPGISLIGNGTADKVTLTTSTVVTTNNSAILDIRLDSDSLNIVKLSTVLGSEDTFITLLPSAAFDLENNPSIEVSGFQLQVGEVFNDTTPVELTSFTLDLDRGRIYLTFSEVVNITSFMTSVATFLEGPNGTELVSMNLDSLPVFQTYTTLYGVLTDATLDEIKIAPTLGTNENVTFVSSLSSFVEDTSGNEMVEINQTAPLKADAVEPDTTRPRLYEFTYSPDDRLLSLTFTEAVNVTGTFQVTELVLQTSPTRNANNSFALTVDSSFSARDSRYVNVSIHDSDLNELYDRSICIDETNCFISFSSILVSDHSDNPIVDTTRQVNTIILDQNPPEIDQFVLFDLNSGTLIIRFSKSVVSSTFNSSYVALASFYDLNAPSTINRVLSGGIVENSLDFTVNLTLSREDLNFLKDSAVCSSQLTCFLTMQQGAVDDFSGNGSVAVTVSILNALTRTPSTFIPDTTGPLVLSVTLDLNSDVMRVVFDEPVQEFTSSALTLQDSLVNATVNYTFGLVSATRISSTTLEFTLSSQDSINVRGILGLVDAIVADLATIGTDRQVSVSYTSDLVNDRTTGGGNAILVSSIVVESISPDATSPTLASFVLLDLDEGTITLSFSEPVNTTTLDHTGIVIVDSSSSTTGVRLSSGNITYNTYNDEPSELSLGEVTIQLTAEDLKDLKLDTTIAKSASTTWVRLEPGVIADSFDNLFNVSSNSMAAERRPDVTNPRLTAFDFDLNVGVLVLSFDDVVDPTTINYLTIIFQNDSTPPLLSHTLTGGPDPATIPADYVLQIQLTDADISSIKTTVGLADSNETTFLSVSTRTIRDLAGEVLDDVILQVSNFTGDVTPPSLVEFNLDINTGNLRLLFSESVVVSTLNVTAITLQNTQNETSMTTYRTLSGGLVNTEGFSDFIDVTLFQEDLDVLKANGMFGGNDTTFLSLLQGGVYDIAGNPSEAVPRTPATPVSDHMIDVLPPELISFDLDMNTGLLSISFDEVVRVSSVVVSGFVLYSSPSSSVSYTLDSSSMVNTTGNFSSNISIYLSDSDLNSIKEITTLATSENDTYLVIKQGAVQDVRMRPIDEIMNINAEQVRYYTRDSTPPQLQGFTLDLNRSALVLTMSEVVDVSSINYTRLELVNSPFTIARTFSLMLSEPSVVRTVGSKLEIVLAVDDLNQIKTASNFATTTINTYFAIGSIAIADFSGLYVAEILPDDAIMANDVLPDESPPTVDEFTLDMNTGYLLISFNEPVSVLNVNYSDIGLTNAPNSARLFILSDSSTSTLVGTTVEVKLTEDDLDVLRLDPVLAKSNLTTRLVLNQTAFADISGNSVAEIQLSSPLVAASVITDITGPKLTSFDFKMDNGTLPLYLVFHFNEPIDETTFNLTSIELLDSSVMPSTIIALNNSMLRSTDSRRDLELVISNSDLSTIRDMTAFGRNSSTTYLNLTDSIVSDVFGNEYQPISSAYPVGVYTADLVRPTLDSFIFDLNEGEIILTFSENVNTDRFNVTGLTLFESLTSTDRSLVLSGGNVSYHGDRQVTVAMENDDLNVIKSMIGFGDSMTATYLGILEG